MMASVENVYTSCSCNRTPHSVDWGVNDLVCFGTSHAVAIYSPKSRVAVTRTLYSHKSRVNSVRWIRKYDGSAETEFISCSCDRTAVIWTQNANCDFIPTAVLEGHEDSITVVDGIYMSSCVDDRMTTPRQLLAVTGSIDSNIKVWMREKGETQLNCYQTINLGRGFSLCVHLAHLFESTDILLLCATDDSKVHMYVSNLKDKFMKVHSLMGHEDWVRALDITKYDSSRLLIATGSQDSMIRLWQLTVRDSATKEQTLSLNEDIQPEKEEFCVKGKTFAVTMESVLTGHDGWIYSVCWHVSNGDCTAVKLLSASLDKSIIVWSPDPQTGLWLENMRVGDMGGNTLGFYGGMFSPDGLSILGHGYQGSFHLWTLCPDNKVWEPKVTVGGHFEEVVDLQWEPGGRYVLSVSKDQTTRLHAPWVHGNNKVTWHEIARPQIHGFDMSCIAILSLNKFASGAEEKVIRAFQAPNNFLENFQRLCKVELSGLKPVNTPRGASVPALGLSNKAVYEDEELPTERHVKDEFPAAYFVPLELKEPPTEEHLMQNTLWPEIQKLYGHGYEIFSLAAHPSGSLLASACKATNVEHAAIILWNTSSWQQQQSLISHQLTVTQLSFSPDGKYLLSVSRDRLWTLFQDSETGFELISKTNNKTGLHSRIIWTCAWSADSKYFATGSRDGKLCIWKPEIGEPKNMCVLELKGTSITAVAFQPNTSDQKYLLAIGLETGDIILYCWFLTSAVLEKVHQLDRNNAHHLAVKRVAFHPLDGSLLASCGVDCCVKIYKLCEC
ncbi:hypothetical protein R5R35_002257 [Gryllus longicercus]|uniref:Elongator complex protein 2 n=1 Tax=Gryllus longicercus TaxID=2509291 RepID=A0AAN9VTF9_9ORTH